MTCCSNDSIIGALIPGLMGIREKNDAIADHNDKGNYFEVYKPRYFGYGRKTIMKAYVTRPGSVVIEKGKGNTAEQDKQIEELIQKLRKEEFDASYKG